MPVLSRLSAGNLDQELALLKDKNLYRLLERVDSPPDAAVVIAGKRLLNFSSNNYLNLSNHPKVKKSSAAAVRMWGAGSGASRLVSGDLKLHRDLEDKLARFKKEEASLIFSSGYLANLGAITALVGENDLVLEDRLNHASLIDAARLSRAKLWIYPHKDARALDKLLERAGSFKKKLVVTDAYFSMDGDIAPLGRLLEVCEKHGAMLMVDEAHSTGIFGNNGSGLVEHFNLSGKIDVVMGTFSKALGSVGGYIAGKNILREYLVNRSRQFIYTTAPSPSASGAALAAIGVIQAQPALRKKYWENILYVRENLKAMGFDLLDSEGPIIPLIIGDTEKTVQMKAFLRKERIFAPAIRPPTVPKNTDRIRLSLTAGHTRQNLEKLLRALKKAQAKLL